MDWDADAIARLRALWAEGHSATAIGRRMGCGKNAVIGKAHRLELTPRKSLIGASAADRRAHRSRTAAAAATDPRVGMIANNTRQERRDFEAAPQPVPDVAFQPRVSRPCAWPIGEPGKPGFRFCGEPGMSGRPYCEHHVKVSRAA